MMKKCVLTVTLNPALDKNIFVRHFHPWRNTLIEKEMVNAGGKGINVARALKNLGSEALAIGIAGGKQGAIFKGYLSREKIKMDFVNSSTETRINTTIIDLFHRINYRILQRGNKVNSNFVRIFRKKYESLLNRSSLVVLSGSNAPGISGGFYRELVITAHRHNIPVAVDTSGADLAQALKARPDIIKPNVEEAEDLLKVKLNDFSKIRMAINNFHRYGVKIVLMTFGKKGAFGSDQKEVWYAHAPRVDAVNEVGCGDSFLGGFVDAYLKGALFKDTLKWAVATGTANTFQYIGGAIDRHAVIILAHRIRLKKF